MKAKEKIVVALGGNALGDSPVEQLNLVKQTAKPIVDLIEAGHEVILAHGNGPQVGMINLAMATASESAFCPRAVVENHRRTIATAIFPIMSIT